VERNYDVAAGLYNEAVKRGHQASMWNLNTLLRRHSSELNKQKVDNFSFDDL